MAQGGFSPTAKDFHLPFVRLRAERISIGVLRAAEIGLMDNRVEVGVPGRGGG